jgi:cytochrome c oxidase subunit 2
MVIFNLAADYGWGPYTLLLIFVIVSIVAIIGIIIVILTGKTKRPQTFASKRRFKFEQYWAIGIAGVLVCLWIISYPWIPQVAFNAIDEEDKKNIQVVNITAGQFFWLMTKEGDPNDLNVGEQAHVNLVVGEPVKFVARSLDVNHGFGIFDGSQDGAPILLQMQVIPDIDNVFYYTFKKPGTYLVRCLEYCGYAHPYMTSIIEVKGSPSTDNNNPVILPVNFSQLDNDKYNYFSIVTERKSEIDGINNFENYLNSPLALTILKKLEYLNFIYVYDTSSYNSKFTIKKGVDYNKYE